MKKPLIIIGIGVLAVGGFFVGRHFYLKNKRNGGSSSSGSTSGGSSSNLEKMIVSPPIFPLSKGSGMNKRINALSTVMDLQEALNRLKPTPMKFLIVDGKYGTLTQGMLKAVGQKMPSLGIGNKTSVSKELFDKIVLASKTSGYVTFWK
tara:strand:+ start:17885 stop:18331 length:447 start_codon:yes stop_codon:yes gene_type:complete